MKERRKEESEWRKRGKEGSEGKKEKRGGGEEGRKEGKSKRNEGRKQAKKERRSSKGRWKGGTNVVKVQKDDRKGRNEGLHEGRIV